MGDTAVGPGGSTEDNKETLGMMDVFTILIVMMDLNYTFDKTYQIIHFKYLQFIVCQLYLNKDVF